MTTLTFTDAAERALVKAGHALKYNEIADTAIKEKYLVTDSQNPAVSMYIALRNEIKRKVER